MKPGLNGSFWDSLLLRYIPNGLAEIISADDRGAVILAALVVSHWVLDWLTHLPDMPLWPDGPKYGLAMWKSLPLTLVVELTMFAVGVAIMRARRGLRTGRERGDSGFSF